MNCKNTYRVIVLTALLAGVVSCREAEQKPVTSVAPEGPAVVEPEPVVAPGTAKESEPVAAEVSSEEQAEQTGPQEDVIVSYGDEKLTSHHVGYLQPGADSKTIKKMADWWLTIHLLGDEAIKRGIDKDPAVKWKADLRAKQMYAEGLKEHVRNSFQVTDQQLLDYYEQNKEVDRQINEPAKLSFTHVASKTLEESQAIFARVKAGQDIVALARELSFDADKRKDGAVRNTPETTVDKRFGAEFLNAVLYASEGDIIGPIKATLGMGRGERYEVARFEGKEPGRIKSFEEVKDYIRTRVERTGKEKAVKDLIKMLEEQAGDKIYKSERISD